MKRRTGRDSKFGSVNDHGQLAWSLFLVALALILVATLYPYVFWRGSLDASHEGASIGLSAPPLRDLLLNILLFVPFGSACVELVRFPRSTTARLLIAGAISAFVSGSIEVIQTMMPSRFSSTLDVLMNTAGGLIGAVCGILLKDRLASCLRSTQKAVVTVERYVHAVPVLVVYLVVVLTASWLLQRETRPSNWDDTYPLLIGNEGTHDRAWTGYIQELEFVPRAFASRDVQSALRTPLVSVLQTGRVTSYRFTAGLPQGFDWRGTVRYQRDRHLGQFVSAAGWLESRTIGSSLSREVKRQGQFTIRLVCQAALADQSGPVRIVSLSMDPYYRNLTIGQQKDALVIRLRTPVTGLNGRDPEFSIPGVFSRLQQRTVVISFDGAALTVAADGAAQLYQFHMSPGTVLASRISTLSAHDLMGPSLLYLLVALGPAGWLFGVAASRWVRASMFRTLLVVTGGLCCALTLQATAASSAGAFGWSDVVVGWLCFVVGACRVLGRPSTDVNRATKRA